MTRATRSRLHTTRGESRPHRWRPALVVGSAFVVMLMSLVAGARPATAAGAGDDASCRHEGRISTSIDGLTRNTTGLTLTRTYLEKGVLNHWGDEPAATIHPHGQDGWCEHADFFGTAMKVTYGFGRNGHVSFEAWRYREGPVGSRCAVGGPDAAVYRCNARIVDPNTRRITVVFTLEPIR